MTNGQDVAFGFDGPNETWHGLTKREYMATTIMAAFSAEPNPGRWGKSEREVAENAVRRADELIAALSQKAVTT